MKLIKYIAILLSALCLLSACSDDDKITFDPDSIQPAKLNELTSQSYILYEESENEVFETFNWNTFDFGYPAAITYVLQVDRAGEDFSSAQDLGFTMKTSLDVSVKTINNAMIILAGEYQLPIDEVWQLEFRIKATPGNSKSESYVFSNTISAQVMPYETEPDYPKVHIIGDYCGWNWNNTQGLFDYNNNGVYEAWIFFDGKAQNGFKLAIPDIKSDGSFAWNSAANWGLDSGQTPDAEATTIQLISKGSSKDIKAYSRNYYRFRFDKALSLLTNVEHMEHLALVGDAANGWDNDIVFDFDAVKQVFVKTVTLTSGEIRFRVDGSDEKSYGGNSGQLAQDGANIQVQEGTYQITVDLKNPARMSYRIKPITSF